MKYSYNWIKELSGTNKTAKEVAELFLTHSFEVEGIENLAKGLDGVVVGEVLSVEKHPDADRLNVAQVNVGQEQLQIVCGALNLEVRQRVPVALVGAKLIAKNKNGEEEVFEIKKGKIRGVESNGMICAENELGLGDNHKEIMVLTSQSQTDADLTQIDAEEPKVGQNFAEYMNLSDKILDIDILPNRGHDCLGYNGIAIELNALEKKEFEIRNLKFEMNNELSKFENNSDLKVDVNTPNSSRYMGIKINNIKIIPSPLWMQARLKASGMKPVNNIVDITNYVMLETGQPLHSFDAKGISSQKSKVKSQKCCNIGVRQAEEGEKLRLLDEQELELCEDDIVITDGEKVIALAGVMGGLQSGIKNSTTEIILEGANFNSTAIRFTARRYNLQTDAAYRFERDVDPNFVDIAMSRALELIKELAGGEITAVTDVYPEPVKPWSVKLSLEYVRKLLGVDISDEEIISILKRLEIKVEKQQGSRSSRKSEVVKRSDWKGVISLLQQDKQITQSNNTLICTIPTRRRDLQTPEDLIEEIGRIYGYEKIIPKAIQSAVQGPKKNEQRFFERQLKKISVQNGFSEIRGYSFYSQSDAEVLGVDKLKHISLLNPANSEQAILRNTLGVSLLKAGRKSLSYFKEIRVFEIGRIYKDKNNTLPQEDVCFGGIVINKGDKGEQFYETKGLIDNILEFFGISDYYYDDKISDKENNKIPELHPSRRALLKNNKGEVVGWLGEASKKAIKYFGLKNVRSALFEIEIDKLRNEVQANFAYQPLPKFPFVERDLSMVVSDKLKVSEVEKTLFKAGGKLIKDIDLFDLYDNEKTGEKSMAFHLIFGDEERTLKAETVDNKISEIMDIVEDELGVEVRK